MEPPFPSPGRILDGPDAWWGSEISDPAVWSHDLDPAGIRELEAAMRACLVAGTRLDRVGREEFPLAQLAPTLGALRDELLHGRGFVRLRGLDPERFTTGEIAAMFWGLGCHLGRPRPQNARGDLLGHVIDLGRDAADPGTRIYQTRERQGFHTDSADLVGLLCLSPAMRGGRSALVSCAAIHNALFERAPDLLAELFAPFCTDHRGEHRSGTRPYFTAPILSWHAERLSVLYQRRYIESAQRFAEVPRLTERQIAALDAFDAVADDPAVHLELQLEAGDILFIHNHQMLHDRTAFDDWPGADRRRHLLRLWLCPPDGRPLPRWFAERLGSVDPGDRGGLLLDGVTPSVTLTP